MDKHTPFSPSGRLRGRSGFTVLELLVASAIIAVLAAILVPVIGSARESARGVQCTSNMKQLGLAFRLYQEDHEGKYPYSWEPLGGNSNNWQSRLGFDEVGPGNFKSYIPQSYITWNGSTFAKRLKTTLLCPTMVQMLRNEGIDMSDTDNVAHGEWGYCYNATRCDISYAANVAFLYGAGAAGYMNANLDVLYSRPASYAVLCDGNRSSWNSDHDWDVFTGDSTTIYNGSDWPARAIHKDHINVLYMDSHVESVNVATADQKDNFNRAWYGGIPAAGNPYAGD